MSNSNKRRGSERWEGSDVGRNDFASKTPWLTDREKAAQQVQTFAEEENLYITGEKMKKGTKDEARNFVAPAGAQGTSTPTTSSSARRKRRHTNNVDNGDTQPNVSRHQDLSEVIGHNITSPTTTSTSIAAGTQLEERGGLSVSPGAVRVPGPGGGRDQDEEDSTWQQSTQSGTHIGGESTTSAPQVLEAQLVVDDDRTGILEENRRLRERVAQMENEPQRPEIIAEGVVTNSSNKLRLWIAKHKRFAGGCVVLVLVSVAIAVVIVAVIGQNGATPSSSPSLSASLSLSPTMTYQPTEAPSLSPSDSTTKSPMPSSTPSMEPTFDDFVVARGTFLQRFDRVNRQPLNETEEYVFEKVLENYTRFFNPRDDPDDGRVNTTSDVTNSQVVGSRRRLIFNESGRWLGSLRRILTSTLPRELQSDLLQIEYAMTYSSAYTNVSTFPDGFREYVNRNLDQLTDDLQDQGLDVTDSFPVVQIRVNSTLPPSQSPSERPSVPPTISQPSPAPKSQSPSAQPSIFPSMSRPSPAPVLPTPSPSETPTSGLAPPPSPAPVLPTPSPSEPPTSGLKPPSSAAPSPGPTLPPTTSPSVASTTLQPSPRPPPPTAAPTQGPTRAPITEIVTSLRNSIGSLQSIQGTLSALPADEAFYEGLYEDPAQPANVRAMSWVLLGDPSEPGPNSPHLDERYALATLFYATGGTEWTDQNGWLTEASLCEWHGVFCDVQNQLVEIDLSSNNLQQELPNEVSLLEHVTAFSVRRNKLTGSVPALAFHEIPGLSILYLDNNMFTGDLDNILSEGILSVLFVQENNFTRGFFPIGFCDDGGLTLDKAGLDCQILTCLCCVPDEHCL